MGLEAARLTVTDLDEVGFPTWRAVYTIVRGGGDGDDGGLFTIATDPASNEGVLKTAKVGVRLVFAMAAEGLPLCGRGGSRRLACRRSPRCLSGRGWALTQETLEGPPVDLEGQDGEAWVFSLPNGQTRKWGRGSFLCAYAIG